jgi:hypothetical protein
VNLGRAALGQDLTVCAIGGIAVDQQAEPAVLPLFCRFPFCVDSHFTTYLMALSAFDLWGLICY